MNDIYRPLGAIHTDEFDDCRAALMAAVAAEHATKWCLRGYRDEFQRVPELITCPVEIDWFAGPDRNIKPKQHVGIRHISVSSN
jgi:hypothetical protein